MSERKTESREAAEDAEGLGQRERGATARSGAVPRVDHALQAPIFVVGATRSGTTVLALMLGHHRDIAHASELEWIWDAPRDAAPEQRNAFLTAHRAFRSNGMRLEPSLEPQALAIDLLRQMRDSHAGSEARNKRELVSQVHRHYAEAFANFPRARFIHIVRDGRDVCASWIKFGWLGNGYEGGLLWKHSLDEWQEARALIPEAQRTEVHFEELIARPEAVLRRLSDFVQLTFDPKMQRFHEDTPYQPIDSGQAGKWAKQLSRRDVRLFESVAADELAKNGYMLSGGPIAPLGTVERLRVTTDAKLKHHRARIERNGVTLWSLELASRVLGWKQLHARVQLAVDDIEDARVRKRNGSLDRKSRPDG